MNVNESKELLQALNEYRDLHNQASGVDLCAMYKRVQPSLGTLVSLLPVVPHGKDIAFVVSSLKQLLDGFCHD